DWFFQALLVLIEVEEIRRRGQRCRSGGRDRRDLVISKARGDHIQSLLDLVSRLKVLFPSLVLCDGTAHFSESTPIFRRDSLEQRQKVSNRRHDAPLSFLF